MAVTRLNHAVLWVRDASASAQFYIDVLGFEATNSLGDGQAVFLRTSPDSLNDHDLGLFSIGVDAGPPTERANVGMYHLAWEVSTLRELVDIQHKLVEAGSLVGASNHGVSKSLYAKDPDGLEFEILWAVPQDLLDPALDSGGITALDLDAEIARFGIDLPARVTA